MFQSTLLLGTFFSLTSAAVYFYVGHRLSLRHVLSPDASTAWNLFVVWWYALASNSFISGVLNLVGAFGITDFPMFLAFTHANLLASCLALYGLMAYLLYLFVGNRKVFILMTLFYIAYYILLDYYLNWLAPVGVVVNRWNASLIFQHQMTGPFFRLVLILLVFPQIIGSFAYFSLYFRVKYATQKYRVALVSSSILIWFLSAFLASISGMAQYDWWQIASRLIGLVAALTILMAYHPAGWIKQRLGVTSISDEKYKSPKNSFPLEEQEL